MAAKEVLSLLVAGDEAASESETFLASSILQTARPLDTEAVKLVEVLSSRAAGEGGGCVLELLVEVISACPAQTLVHNFSKWSLVLIQALQGTTDPTTVHTAFKGLHTLLHSLSTCPQALPKVDPQALPPLLQALLQYHTPSTAPALQVLALRLVASCLVHFGSSCSQFRPGFKKWAASAIFSSHMPLSQEASRVLVLLCRHSNQQWGSMVASVMCGVEWAVRRLHRASSKSDSDEPPSTVTSWLAPPTPPKTDPERTGVLMRVLTQLTRTLCYSLLFPPQDPAHLPSVPLQRVLAVVSEGLRTATSGHTVEALVLQVTTPVLYMAMWGVLDTLIRTCHAHLLPYSAHVQWLLLTALTSQDIAQSPVLLDTVHRTLATWVGVAKDYTTTFTTPVLHLLLKSCDHTHQLVRTSSLKTLGTLVSLLGPLVAPPPAVATLRLVMEGLTPSLPAPEALSLIRLLKGCIASRNTHLTPPTCAAIQLLTDMASHHVDSEVVSMCRSCLAYLHTSLESSNLQPPSLSQRETSSSADTLPLVPLLPPRMSSQATPTTSLATPTASKATPMSSKTTPTVSQATPTSSQSMSTSSPSSHLQASTPSIDLTQTRQRAKRTRAEPEATAGSGKRSRQERQETVSPGRQQSGQEGGKGGSSQRGVEEGREEVGEMECVGEVSRASSKEKCELEGKEDHFVSEPETASGAGPSEENVMDAGSEDAVETELGVGGGEEEVVVDSSSDSETSLLQYFVPDSPSSE